MESGSDSYSLKWTDFRSDFTEGFRDLLQEEAMVDVTLAVEGQVLQAHKLVLSVCSPYFKTLFKINPCKHPIVIMNDVSHSDFSHMLDFMYKGEVGVRQDDLTSFLKLAEMLKIKGLTEEQISKDSSALKRRRIERKKIVPDVVTDSESESSFSTRKRFKRRTKTASKGKKNPKVKVEFVEKLECSRVLGGQNADVMKLMDKSAKDNTADDDSSSNGDDDLNHDDFETSRTYYEADNNQDAGDQGLQARGRKFSLVWSYFHMVADGVICKACGKYLRGHWTTNAVSHLARHKDTYKEFMMRKKDPYNYLPSIIPPDYFVDST